MARIYCGNNSLDAELVAGTVVLGSRYKCLRKGVGRGLRLPYDAKFAGDYKAIDNRRIYCGDKDALPNGYDSIGNLPRCLQKGVGIGRRKRAMKGIEQEAKWAWPVKKRASKTTSAVLPFTILVTGLFLVLYMGKPSIVTTRDSNNKNIIDWGKFMAIYLPTTAIATCILFWRIHM